MSKQDDIKDNTIKDLQKKLNLLEKNYKELSEAVPVNTIIEGLIFKTDKLSSYTSDASALEDDPEVLDEYIEELQAVLKTAKFVKQLLDT
jgi:prefoldin subunit 5